MERYIKHNLLSLFIIFIYLIQFKYVLAEDNEDKWNIIYPQENESIDRNDKSKYICWEYSEMAVIDVRNITVTVNDESNLSYDSGYIIAENIEPSKKNIKFKIEKEIKSGKKKVVIWNAENKELLYTGKTFFINEINNSNFDFSYGIYVILCLIIAVPGVGYAIQYKKRNKSIPTGSRSIHTLTVNRRKTYEPPIQSYRESWIELPQANSINDQVNIKEMYEYDLLEEAEEAAKNMGLIDKVFKAKKVFIPSRDDELLIRIDDELIVKEIYDDLWCYGQNKSLYEEEYKKNPKRFNGIENLDIQEREELTKFGMFPSVVLPIEFRNAKLTQATVEAIKEASEVAEPIAEDIVIKKDPNSVVITIPSLPTPPEKYVLPTSPHESYVLPVNNLQRSSSLRSSLHRRATQRTNASSNSVRKPKIIKKNKNSNTTVTVTPNPPPPPTPTPLSPQEKEENINTKQ